LRARLLRRSLGGRGLGELRREGGVLGGLLRGSLLEALALGLGVCVGLPLVGGRALLAEPDLGDPEDHQLLAVALLDPAASLRAVLERDQLLAAVATDDFGLDRGVRDDRRPD